MQLRRMLLTWHAHPARSRHGQNARATLGFGFAAVWREPLDVCLRSAIRVESYANMKTELIVALDVPSSDRIAPIVDALPEEVNWYKVGLELFVAEGPAALGPLKERGKRIFLDLKLHDIPRTVARAVRSAGRLGVDLLTVHGSGGRDMLQAAAEAAAETGDRPLQLLAITVLTSLSDADLAEMNVSQNATAQAISLGNLAVSSGIDGLVCSPQELSRFREGLGTDPIIVTPGIRPAGGDVGDQKRVATPSMAVSAGSSYLVVGRPILQAENPRQAAEAILAEMAAATPFVVGP